MIAIIRAVATSLLAVNPSIMSTIAQKILFNKQSLLAITITMIQGMMILLGIYCDDSSWSLYLGFDFWIYLFIYLFC